MNTKIAIAIVALTLLGVGAFVYEKKRDHFPVTYLPYVPSADVTAITTIATSTVDYMKLEKDTILYRGGRKV